VYLFYLDTAGFKSLPGGPYSYMNVPYSYYGTDRVPFSNALPDVAVSGGTAQVTWFQQLISPNELQGSGGASGNAQVNAGNVSQEPVPSAMFPQASDIANSVGVPILVGCLVQSTSVSSFQRAVSQAGTTAPIVSQSSAALNVSAPQQSSGSTVQMTAAHYATNDDSDMIVGTQNPPASSPPVSDGGLSLFDVAIIIGVAALIFA
jgi:hypothetical protein